MAGTFTPSGPGTVGDIAPGWTVQEDATVHIPGDGAGSTGLVNVSGEAKADTVFLMDNPSTFTATKGDGSSFGTISGSVASVNTRGLTASLTQTTTFANLAVNRSIPPVASGHPTAALDQALQLTGSKFCTLTYPGGVYWSGRGHDSGFDYKGALVTPVDAGVTTAQNSALLNFVQQTTAIKNNFTVTQFNNLLDTPRTTFATGSSPTVTPGRRTMIMYRNNSSNYSSLNLVYGPGNAANNTGKSFQVYLNMATQIMTIKGTYFTGGVFTPVSQNISIASVLTPSSDLQIIVDANWVSATVYNLTVYVANTTALGTVVTLSTGNLTTGNDITSSRWQVACIGRDFYQLEADQTFTPSALMVSYANPSAFYTSVAAMTPASQYADNPIVSYTGSVWDYINQVASATGVDYYFANGVVGVRPTGSVPVVIDSFEPSPNIQVSKNGIAQNVNITNYNSYSVQSQLIYEAVTQPDTWEVTPGQVTKNIITTQNSVEFVYNPFPADDYATYHFYRDLSTPRGLLGNTRTNVVTNPDFEDGTTSSWTPQNGATLANSTLHPSQGTRGLAVTTTSSVGSGTTNISNLSTGFRGVNAAASVDLWIPSGVTVQAQLYYNNGVSFSGIGSLISTVGTASIQRLSLPPTSVPFDAISEPVLYLYTSGTATTFYVDMVDIENSNVNITTPFNGNTPSSLTTTYAWVGTINGSKSTATPTGNTGAYAVLDNNNVAIPGYTWVGSGGSVTLSVIDSNHIGMTIVAPMIGGYPGPYTLATLTPGGVVEPALSIVGSGTIAVPTVTNFATGADPLFTTTLQAGDIDNVAIGSSARQATAALWANTFVGGPTVRLDATVAIDVFQSFGLVSGSTFIYQNQRWRVINASIGNLGVNLTCYPYTTVADYTSVWSGKLVSDLETAWSGKKQDDFNIQPLNVTP